MGYNIIYEGEICIDKILDDKTCNSIISLNNPNQYFENIFENQYSHSSPWTIGNNKKTLVWDRLEKSYDGHEWLKYIIDNILIPKGYHATGIINWFTEEDIDDSYEWCTVVNNNLITKHKGYNNNIKIPNYSEWMYGEWLYDFISECKNDENSALNNKEKDAMITSLKLDIEKLKMNPQDNSKHLIEIITNLLKLIT